MKKLFLLFVLTLMFFSCGKKQEQPTPDDIKRQELELKQKQLDSIENEMKKDSIKKLSGFNWEGDYSYVIKGDRGHEWHYDLKISKGQNGYSAIFDAFGYQMAYPMVGSVVIEGNRAKIFFEKFHDEPMINDMRKGDLLVELENTGTDILTYWHKAMDLDNVKSGVVALKKVKGESFSFMNKDMVFGSSFEDFLKTFPEFKENNELKSGNEKVASYTSRPKGCEINYNVYFGNSGLKKFEMHSNCTSGQDEKIIKIITSQFKLIPSKKSDEEEMGDIMQTYKKGKLIAEEFIGGFYRLTIEYKK